MDSKGTDLFLQKLDATPSSAKCEGCSDGCSRMKNSSKRAGVLFAFHLLNALLGVGGAIFGALMLTSIAFMPTWIAAVALFGIAYVLIHAAQSIEQKCLRYFGYVVLVALYMLTLMNVYTAYMPYAAFGVGLVGVGIFYLSVIIMKQLVRKDVQLANYAMPAISTSPETEEMLDPDACAEQFTLPRSSDQDVLLPHVRLKCHGWTAAFYFAIAKVVIGSLSAAIILVVAINPSIAVCNGGNDLLVNRWISQDGNVLAFIGIFCALWVLGVVGLRAVATLSVKLTSCVCKEWASDAVAEQQSGLESALPVTPSQEQSAANFSAI